MSDTAPSGELKPFFYDVAELPGFTIADVATDDEAGHRMIELFGRDLLTKPIVSTSEFSIYHETAKPGERVKPHRHGTVQINHILRGELVFGNRRLTAGMGYVNPDTMYAWRAGDEGAEWLEIHFGQPGIYTERRKD